MRIGAAERTWLILIGLTLAGAFLAETGHAGWLLTLLVALLIGLKGRLVIDHYMEMTQANSRIRWVLYLFTTLVPLLVLLSHYFGDALKRITSII